MPTSSPPCLQAVGLCPVTGRCRTAAETALRPRPAAAASGTASTLRSGKAGALVRCGIGAALSEAGAAAALIMAAGVAGIRRGGRALLGTAAAAAA